jgi:hypothetical protein
MGNKENTAFIKPFTTLLARVTVAELAIYKLKV